MARRENERIERQLRPLKVALWFLGAAALLLAVVVSLLVLLGRTDAAGPLAALTGTCGVCFIGLLAYRGHKRMELHQRSEVLDHG
ncbi:hypothetical protein [Streptomyces sp. NPDC023588]|uniref:hypothetical protein n=1 Tax=Streptomyces sp. NPDC023588 TaxID=3154907 RepID=UPI0033F1C6F3